MNLVLAESYRPGESIGEVGKGCYGQDESDGGSVMREIGAGWQLLADMTRLSLLFSFV
jgi:hypothetical protein